MNFRKQSQSDHIEINLVPLIDVLLVILIFLAATTTFTRIQQLEVNLPQGTADTQSTQGLSISITSNGIFTLQDQTLDASSIEQLTQALSQAKAAQIPNTENDKTTLVIHADANASHQNVVKVMQAAAQADIENISFATQDQPN